MGFLRQALSLILSGFLLSSQAFGQAQKPASPPSSQEPAQRAHPDLKRARRAAERGEKAEAAGRFEEALASFEEAARYAPQAKNMVPRPPITTNASVKSGSVLNQSPEMNAANRLPRREVQNALNVLRGMPPASRQRWIDSGRYNSFSPEERDLLKHVSDERALATTRSTATESGQH